MTAVPLTYCRPPPADPRWLVVCLCAEWCGACRDYRQPLAAVAGEFPEHAFAWIDIEDESGARHQENSVREAQQVCVSDEIFMGWVS